MKDDLVRFGVSMDDSLLQHFDRLVERRGTTRSEALRDLVRADVSRSFAATHAPSIAALTLVYNHHVRELNDTLIDMQHELGDRVRSTMHVHVDSELCMEVIVLRGPADELHDAAQRLLSTRGVTHGGIEIVALSPRLERPPETHGHAHAHAQHSHEHSHEHAPQGSRVAASAKDTRDPEPSTSPNPRTKRTRRKRTAPV